MSGHRQASGIPNLMSLRGNRGGREVGTGRGRGLAASANRPLSLSADHVVQRTDQDASDSRMSAVSVGYLNDPFATHFAKSKESPRRMPIINRGTYARTTAIDTLVDKFLQTDPQRRKQIISLGAGSDTRYFRLVSNDPSLRLVYHELDFPANTSSKISTIKTSPNLLKAIQDHINTQSQDEVQIAADGAELRSPTYNIHAIDLRRLADSDPKDLITIPNLSPTSATLVLSECCLVYLPPEAADGVLKALVNHHIPSPTPLSVVLYEPIRPHDPFGQVMISNLAQRGIVLQTLHKYSSLSAQRLRLQAADLVSGQQAADVNFLFNRWTVESEKVRVAMCEMFDELEEWVMLGQHYCVAWGWRDGDADGDDLFTRAWRGLPAQPEESQ